MPYMYLDGIRIKYHTIGDGEPIIFISGLGMDHRVWVNQVPFFCKDFRVITFDNRGIGESTDDGKRFTTFLLAEDVFNLMKHLKIEKANIVGSSLGGMIAQELAINHPDRIDKLILSSTTAKLERKSRRERFFIELEKVLVGDVEILIDIDSNHPIFNRAINHVLQEAYSRDFLVRNATFIKNLIREYFSKKNYYEVLLKQVGAALRHDTRSRLRHIKAKTLVLSGTLDRIIPIDQSRKLSYGINGAEFVEIKYGPHALPFERADEFNHILYNFLN